MLQVREFKNFHAVKIIRKQVRKSEFILKNITVDLESIAIPTSCPMLHTDFSFRKMFAQVKGALQKVGVAINLPLDKFYLFSL
jgi:hypothetical protein